MKVKVLFKGKVEWITVKHQLSEFQLTEQPITLVLIMYYSEVLSLNFIINAKVLYWIHSSK